MPDAEPGTASPALPSRWVCRDGEGLRGAAVAWARRAAEEARAQGHDVDLTVLPPSAEDPDWEHHDLLVALGNDPRAASTWWPAVAAGARVLLPAAPGTADALREAVSLGAAATVADPADPVAVLAAVRRLADAPAEHREVAAAVVRRRQAGHPVDTRPRVLAVALDAAGLKTALTTLRYVTELGGDCHLLLRRGVPRRGWREPPEAASVTYVEDPTLSSPAARAERLLLVRAPQSAASRLPRLLSAVTRRTPARARRPAETVGGAVCRVADGWTSVGQALHRRAWNRVALRLRPWLIARRALRYGPPPPWRREDLDLIVAPGADAQALVWQLLRQHPRASSRGSITYHAVAEVVRRRASEAARS